MKDEQFRQSRDVTAILVDSIIKDVKGRELTDESKNVVVKSFCEATTIRRIRSVALNEVTFLRLKFTKNLVFGHLNVNSVMNKFEALERLFGK